MVLLSPMILIIGTIAAFMINLFRVLDKKEIERNSNLSARETVAEIDSFRGRGFEVIRSIIRRVDR